MAHPEGPWRRSPFDHRQHLKFAWAVLGELPLDQATAVVADEIRTFADAHAPGKYHDTLTRFFVALIAHTRSVDERSNDFESHLASFPILLDKHAPERHYSASVLGSPESRSGFVEPDLLPIP